MECLHQHGWFEDFEHSRQSRVEKQRGSEEMFGQSRAEVEQSIDRQGRGRVAELGGLDLVQTLIYELQDRAGRIMGAWRRDDGNICEIGKGICRRGGAWCRQRQGKERRGVAELGGL